MDIVKATPEYASIIADMLSKHFEFINSQFGYNKYKTDMEKIFQHVSDRLSSAESEFKYYVLLDNTIPVGFINTVCSPMVYEIIALCLLKEFDTVENASKLLEYAINELKTQGADKILTEVTGLEHSYRKALQAMNSTLVEQKFLIN